ncbi:MAG: peptidase domain-containing ABC transporter [Bacteroidota bacterium]
MVDNFPFYKQMDSMDCGPTCLRMVAKFYGKNLSLSYLREKCYIDREGVSLKGICEASENIGMRSLAVKVALHDEEHIPSLSRAPLPAIIHWNQNHFVVLYRVSKSHAWISDPARGKFKITIEEFNKKYCSDNNTGIALLLEPTPEFSRESHQTEEQDRGIAFLLSYVKPYHRLIFQLLIGLLLGTLFQLIFPFLTQSLVDIGIENKNIDFIYLILFGQIFLFISQIFVRFIQSWILLHISARINVSLVSDFLVKLMKLPLGFFDSKNTGDLLQRIGDHNRIESFLTQSTLSFLLSVVSVIVFGVVLATYSINIFLIFLIASLLYVSWIFLFLKKRREIDYRSFQQMSDNQDSLIEIIQGMQEINLQGSHLKRRWKWATIQARLFKTQMKSLSISQYQDAGALSINQLKDILITFLAAKLVLDGELTLGMMLAVQYTIGQLNLPLQQLVGFVRSAQDAFISIERLSEVHNNRNEEDEEIQKLAHIPDEHIYLRNVSFRYTPISKDVIDDISITIPRKKITAIVGSSGSGKTTLIKLLLGFYKPTQGNIFVGSQNLESIQKEAWRSECGVVMQEGFIFSDSIANNISESDDRPDLAKVIAAATTANIFDYTSTLPLGLNTMIGAKGNGISQGQKQRLLIARAVYKNPDFLFFDEATNALDANNEKVIMENLNEFFKGKTAIVVAHRLSTVKNADQIIVMENGRIVEVGTHDSLVRSKNFYYSLVRNQLELGN